MPNSYSNIIFGGKCIYVVDELVGWLVRLLVDTPRLDHHVVTDARTNVNRLSCQLLQT